ncbi:MAG: putative DNA binding domain-containing protein [Bacteroidetes bacterium]|nr:putative DNA binding domain-containing protein [Bacteroidota bacterium]
MEPLEYIERIQNGEDSRTQFKETINHPNQLAQEFVAFSNSEGGLLFIGVSKTSEIVGLTPEEIERINQHISNVASQQVRSPIAPLTENVNIEGKIIIVVNISKGLNKPYYTNDGIAYVKMGSDKRIAPPEEILRMFQESNKIAADELGVPGTSTHDLRMDVFKKFIEQKTGRSFDSLNLPLSELLNNMGFAKDQSLTLAGLLLFGTNPQRYRPLFTVQCISYIGTEVSGSEFRDSEPPFEGNISELFEKTMNFIVRNLHNVQVEKSFNSSGKLEIPREALEEIVVNSLVHRDYFLSSTIKVFIFDDRIEIISPGKLPNNLTIENIKAGTSNARNPILFTNARYLVPFVGVGSGIPRAISLYPNIDLINDQERELLITILRRQ